MVSTRDLGSLCDSVSAGRISFLSSNTAKSAFTKFCCGIPALDLLHKVQMFRTVTRSLSTAARSSLRIGLIPADGIGKEVIPVCLEHPL